MTASQRKTSTPESPAGVAPGFGAATGIFDMLEWQLGFWRQNADLALSMLRSQQDQSIRFWREQLSRLEAGARQPGGQPLLPFAPMASAMKAAGQLGEAALEAQRDALDALRPR